MVKKSEFNFICELFDWMKLDSMKLCIPTNKKFKKFWSWEFWIKTWNLLQNHGWIQNFIIVLENCEINQTFVVKKWHYTFLHFNMKKLNCIQV